LSRPKNLSQAVLSGELAFLDIDWAIPFFSHIPIHPGHG
jgi:hypothetical protein